MRGILFDFNGVIVDDEPQHCQALIATLAEQGFALDAETYYRDYLGFDDRECFRYAFQRMGRSGGNGLIAQAISRKAELYERSIRQAMTLVPGAGEFVRAAGQRGLALAVVSGALRREIELVLGLAGLRDYFRVIVAAEDVAACKPDPGGYRLALHQLGLPPERCIVLEDSLPGLAAAHAAGMPCVMIATSHDRDALGNAELIWDNLCGHTPDELPWTRD